VYLEDKQAEESPSKINCLSKRRPYFRRIVIDISQPDGITLYIFRGL